MEKRTYLCKIWTLKTHHLESRDSGLDNLASVRRRRWTRRHGCRIQHQQSCSFKECVLLCVSFFLLSKGEFGGSSELK